jgi:hypothetical protein
MIWTDFETMRLNKKTDEYDLFSSKIHAFVSSECKKPYTGEKYLGNRSLCGKFNVDCTGDEMPTEWNRLKSDASIQLGVSKHEVESGQVCLTCFKLSKR